MTTQRQANQTRRRTSCIQAGFFWAALIVTAWAASGCGVFQQSSLPELKVVDSVDIERYLGTWYEIARYPNGFEQGCEGVTAEYSLRADGSVNVLNTCRDAEGNATETIQGYATVTDTKTNAKLAVTFFWPFSAPYWIIDLDPDYRYAVVGEPTRSFFWILSRTPTLDQETIDAITDRMPDWSYDPERLEYVEQPDAQQSSASQQ